MQHEVQCPRAPKKAIKEIKFKNGRNKPRKLIFDDIDDDFIYDLIMRLNMLKEKIEKEQLILSDKIEELGIEKTSLISVFSQLNISGKLKGKRYH